ncbi:uncharacterized protein A4U43_C07F18270 [Asparagus officinalis]|uniref:Uncharacterized protein n=1 Tax=Asparagus officinalis TaxID=4686 RepID=A0A5P1ECW0_ASPOF|nr:uncharacterized protein A4U43_C07F18270 [Asparagus officinalis]
MGKFLRRARTLLPQRGMAAAGQGGWCRDDENMRVRQALQNPWPQSSSKGILSFSSYLVWQTEQQGTFMLDLLLARRINQSHPQLESIPRCCCKRKNPKEEEEEEKLGLFDSEETR